MVFLDSFTSLFCCGEVTAEAEVSTPTQDHNNSTPQENVKSFTPTVDPMNANNYLVIQLTRPMGILFEENLDHQQPYGGAFVAVIKEGCSAAEDGSICRGDQLVGIGKKRVSGMDFGEVMKIIEGSDRKITLTVFRGPVESLYGSSGASVEWLDAFVAERGEEKDSLDDVAAEVLDAVSETVKTEMFNVVAAAVHDAIGDIDKADETLADVEEEDELVVINDEVEMDEWTDPEADIAEKEATKEEESVVIDNDVTVETEAVSAEGEVLVENEVNLDGELECESDLDRGCDTAAVTEPEEAAVVSIENEVEADVGAPFEADQEEEPDTTDEGLVVVENEVDAEEAVDREVDSVKEADTEEAAVVTIENEVEANVGAPFEADQEEELDTEDEDLVFVASEADTEEAADRGVYLDIEEDTTEEALDKLELETHEILKVIVENQVKAADLAQETDTPTLNGGVNASNKENKDLLDIGYADSNTESESISTALASVD